MRLKSVTLAATAIAAVVRCFMSAVSALRHGLLVIALLFAATLALAAPTTPPEDFTDNLDGTVTHRITGLTWMRCAVGMIWTGATCTGTASTYTWDQATKLTLSFAGKTDWRLPSIAELNTIVERESGVPALSGAIFPNRSSSSFWSASPNVGGSSFAWVSDVGDGGAFYGTRSNGHAVRLVRGQSFDPVAPSTPSADFVDNGDSTVTHIKTGWMWKRCAEGQTWSGTTCSGTASTYDWGTAVALTSSSAGHSDWRLPTENELLTIVEYQAYTPAINTAIFPNTASACFWSGSPYANISSYAWYVYFDSGGADRSSRSDGCAVRLMRGGQFFGPSGFAAQTDAATGALLTSNLLKIAPGSTAMPISIVGGSYSINGGTYTTATGTVNANDSVTVRVTSAAGAGVSTRATLTVGGIGGNFIVTTSATADSQSPSIPTNVKASASTENAINLSWSAATDNVGVTAYRVMRNGNWLATLGAVTSFADSGLSAATTYTYSVAACDAAGNCSAQSAAASATTPATHVSGQTTPTADFIDNGDGTVTHRPSGLTWMRCAMGMTWTGSTCAGMASTYTWDDATRLTANFAGKSDWRLPSVAELSSIVEREAADPAINSEIFPNTAGWYFWSGSLYAYSSDFAWYVSFSAGGADGYGYRNSNGSAVRLVRGELTVGSPSSFTPSTDFFNNGDGTVTHLKTGLMWKRCAEGQVWSGTTCSGSASTYAWGAAVALTSESAGYGDWRIPTENELLTIVEYKAHSPAINTAIFLNTASSYFWSGSRLANSSSDAWYVNFDDGYADSRYDRSANGAVRLVRSGQFFGPWGFKTKTGVAANTSVTSNGLTVYGNGGIITVQGGEYSINSGPYTAAAGTVKANDSVQVRVTTTSGMTSVALLTIGTVSGPFRVTAAPPLAANPAAPTVKLATGSSHSAGIRSDGSLLIWGNNDSGELGLGSTGGARTAPQAAPHGSNYQSLALGASHSVALRTDGSLWAWGGNASGQLGDGSATTRSSPVQIGSDYIAAAAGNAHSLGIKIDRSLWAWGNNRSGQLGNGAANSAANPVQVGTSFYTVTAGTSHSVGIKTDGGLWAWGANTFGQIGDGTGYDRYAPTLVGKGYAAVAAGAFHTIALSTDGGLWSWGQNEVGQLGDGSATMRATPRQIGTRFGAVAAGTSHSIALKQDGTVWAWGSNASGQLGLGTSTQSRIPQQLPGVTGVSAIAAGGNMSLALKGDGTVLAWGSNNTGQLGDGTFGQRLSPVLVVKTGATGFLNLAEDTVLPVPPALNVPFFVTGTGSISATSATVSTSTRFNPADAGKIGAVYVTAMVPTGSLGAIGAVKGAYPTMFSALVGDLKAAVAAATPAFTLIQLTATGWKTVVNGQLVPYASGVLTDQIAAQSILNNTATTALPGAQFCVGYGTSAEDMLANGNMRVVATIPGATAPTSCVVGSTLTVGLSVKAGWNLLGNPVKQTISVADKFGDSSKVISVWKWDSANGNWQFFAPSMTATDLLAYATSQGFGVLSEINGGDGYWVNAKAVSDFGSISGEAITLRQESLASGWNLMATSNPVTPQSFNLSLSTVPPTAGQVPINMTSLWAWDSAQSNWFFYAPSLEAAGGNAFLDFISNQHYLDFAAGNKKLGNGEGFWVKRD